MGEWNLGRRDSGDKGEKGAEGGCGGGCGHAQQNRGWGVWAGRDSSHTEGENRIVWKLDTDEAVGLWVTGRCEGDSGGHQGQAWANMATGEAAQGETVKNTLLVCDTVVLFKEPLPLHMIGRCCFAQHLIGWTRCTGLAPSLPSGPRFIKLLRVNIWVLSRKSFSLTPTGRLNKIYNTFTVTLKLVKSSF